MVVFSDLDRSIIYSKRFLGEDKSELEIEIYKWTYSWHETYSNHH